MSDPKREVLPLFANLSDEDQAALDDLRYGGEIDWGAVAEGIERMQDPAHAKSPLNLEQ